MKTKPHPFTTTYHLCPQCDKAHDGNGTFLMALPDDCPGVVTMDDCHECRESVQLAFTPEEHRNFMTFGAVVFGVFVAGAVVVWAVLKLVNL